MRVRACVDARGGGGGGDRIRYVICYQIRLCIVVMFHV